MSELILASSSPRRRELLAKLGLAYVVRPADVDETLNAGETADTAVVRLAGLKAERLAARFPGAIILAADTLVADPADAPLGKQANAVEADVVLRRLRAQWHRVVTGVAVRTPSYNYTGLVSTAVLMRDYSDADIRAYIATEDWRDKAGGYAIQFASFRPVERIAGCYTNVFGLPLCLTYRCLRAVGLAPHVAGLAACDAYGNRCALAAEIVLSAEC